MNGAMVFLMRNGAADTALVRSMPLVRSIWRHSPALARMISGSTGIPGFRTPLLCRSSVGTYRRPAGIVLPLLSVVFVVIGPRADPGFRELRMMVKPGCTACDAGTAVIL